MDISFIIPAYNAESEIEKCVYSIQKWDYAPEIEIIIINDGSRDQTLSMCWELAKEDSRVSVFSIENSGQGVARNYGLKHASGEYVCFVDADDEIIAENIYKMWNKAKEKKVNIVMGSYVRQADSKLQFPNLPAIEDFFSKDKGIDSLYHKIKAESAFGYVWNKLYEKRFLEMNNLRMDDIRTVYMEDLLFNMKVWSRNPKIYYMGIPVYVYHVENESTTRKLDENIHIKNVAMIDNMTNYLERNNILDDNLDMVIPMIMRMYCWSLVKNIPYEGISIHKIKQRSSVFCNSIAVRKCIENGNVVKQLFSLPSKAQSLFYTLSYYCLKWKWNTLMATIISTTYPVLKYYISGAVK